MGNILNGVTFDNIMYVGGDKTIRAGKIFTGLMGSWRHSSNRLKNIVWLVETQTWKLSYIVLLSAEARIWWPVLKPILLETLSIINTCIVVYVWLFYFMVPLTLEH